MTRRRTSRKLRPNAMKITSDGKWHHFKYRDEVPKRVLASQFDHLDPDNASDMFLKYRNSWYHISDFMRAEGGFPGWDGYAGITFSSAVVIKVAPDGESYKIGLATS
jgi:hypothetical protein